jgi:dihydroxyacetone kinase-like protein
MNALTPTLLNAEAVAAALARACAAVEAAAPELTALDARLGDGDLGATLAKCAGNLRTVLADKPPRLEALLKGCALACARASGSSFGTLLTLAFLTASRQVGERESLDRDALVTLLNAVAEAISQRGGAVQGDKTMLDSLASITSALRHEKDAHPQALKAAAQRATMEALDAFRRRPNRIGRARMFADRSIGLDDPGMVAVQRMVQAL